MNSIIFREASSVSQLNSCRINPAETQNELTIACAAKFSIEATNVGILLQSKVL
jgi:hypothetical protein